jgi:hypothetical protein
MIGAAIYIFKPPKARRETLLYRYQRDLNWRDLGLLQRREPGVAEPAPLFDHSRRAPLIVLAAFRNGAITHVADGRKGASAGTGLVRLNLSSIQELKKPIRFAAISRRAPARIRQHVRRVLEHGGKLPPKTSNAVADVMLSLEPTLANRMARLSKRRASWLRDLTPAQGENLAIQKETLAAALEIAGLRTEELLAWVPPEGETRLFLEGLPRVYVREDAMLLTDFDNFPGFEGRQILPLCG